MQSQHQPQPTEKLKESCTNCAFSKVRCSKDKPMCTRCEDRDLECYYTPSQRSGRRSAASSASAAASALTSTAPPAEPVNCGGYETSPYSAPASVTSIHDYLSTFSPNHFHSECRPPSREQAISAPNFDGTTFDTVMEPTSTYDLVDNDGFASLDHYLNGSSTDSLASFNCVDPFLGDFNCGHPSVPSTPTYPFPNAYNPCFKENKPMVDQSNSCLTLALRMLANLHVAPQACRSFPAPGGKSYPIPMVDSVISSNKAIIDSISIMLTCSCSLDEQLASILSLIAFKVMAWYAAAARDADHSSDSANNLTTLGPERVLQLPITVGKYRLNSADHCRMRAQLVLSELHRVVRLVEQLSKRFQEARARINMAASSSGAEDAATKGHWLSASVFVMLDADLRKRLQSLTKEMMAILRSE